MIPVPSTILESLARTFGTTSSSLHQSGGGREDSDGVIYDYPYRDRRRLLKIIAIPLADQRNGMLRLESRLQFMRFLGENKAPIVFPQLSPQDNIYESMLDDAHLWVGYCMEIAPGKTIRAETWDDGFFRNWGQAIGMLHRLAQEYPSWEGSIDPASGERFLTWREEWQDFYGWIQDDEVRQKWEEIRQPLEALPVTRQVFGFTHNDPHLWNLLVEDNRVIVLDFDVANHHWFINDIAIACQSILFALSGGLDKPVYDRAKLLSFLRLFMEGYEREHHLSVEWLDRLDLFVAYRRILLFTVMQGWLRSNPDRYASWKQMILSAPEVLGRFS